MSPKFINYIVESQIDFVFDKYRNLLNEFIELDLQDLNKKDFFKFYANEFKDAIKEQLFFSASLKPLNKPANTKSKFSKS